MMDHSTAMRIDDDGLRIMFPSPAGRATHKLTQPASRPGLASGPLILLDNGQARHEVDSYGDLLSWLGEDLTGAGAACRAEADLVMLDREGIDRVAETILADGPSAVVISLCHAGVTAPTALLAGQLERVGVPTVLLCTPQGKPLADFMTSHDVPGLPLVLATRIDRLEDSAQAEHRQHIVSAVAEGLMVTPVRRDLGVAASAEVRVEVWDRDRSLVDLAADLGAELWERLIDGRMSDGLPVCLPTERGIAAMVAGSGRPESEVLLDGPTPRQKPITVGDVALNALLAGCRPEYMPVVVAAVEAMAAEQFRFFQAVVTSHPSGVAVAVSGPIADAIGMQCGAGALGPGFRANATIGRAVNMVIMNVGGAVPGLSSLSTFGSPAQYTYCFAELLEGNPWGRYHLDLYDDETSSVTVLKCESPHNVLPSQGGRAEGLLESLATALSSTTSNAARYPADHLVLVSPVQAQTLSAAGYGKRDVQMYLFEHARIPNRSLGHHSGPQPPWTRDLPQVPVVRDPAEFRIFVTGGLGPPVMVAPPWGLSRAVTVPVRGPRQISGERPC
jgi:hypothetical protein